MFCFYVPSICLMAIGIVIDHELILLPEESHCAPLYLDRF